MVKLVELFKIAGIVTLLFFGMYAILGMLCKWLDFDLRDTITAKFCGTKKSLVHGSVMVKIIFGASVSAGIFLLPIMLYHILQLFVVTVFAEKYRKREDLISE
jgi:sodium/bile acid cotransporter 7